LPFTHVRSAFPNAFSHTPARFSFGLSDVETPSRRLSDLFLPFL
jgi:hypothetical protein